MTVSAATIPEVQRRCVVFIGGPVTPNKLQPGTAERPVIVINERSNDLPVRVKFKKPLIWTPNLGSVEIWNLAPETRAIVQGKNVRVAVFVGYGNNLQQLGVLAAQQINHKHDGPAWLTKMEGGDGGRAFYHGRVSKSFAPGTPIGDMAKQLGQVLGKMSPAAIQKIEQRASGRSTKNGKVLHGKVVNEFKAIMDDLGLDFVVVDEEVRVLEKGKTTQEVLEITPESGLIGSPEYAAPPHPGKPQLLKIRTLLNPTLKPGAKIVLKSATHSGEFVCRDVSHSGATWENEWFSDAELMALKGAK